MYGFSSTGGVYPVVLSPDEMALMLSRILGKSVSAASSFPSALSARHCLMS